MIRHQKRCGNQYHDEKDDSNKEQVWCWQDWIAKQKQKFKDLKNEFQGYKEEKEEELNTYKNQYEELGDQLGGSKVKREQDFTALKKRTNEAEIALTVYQKTKKLEIENLRHAF